MLTGLQIVCLTILSIPATASTLGQSALDGISPPQHDEEENLFPDRNPKSSISLHDGFVPREDSSPSRSRRSLFSLLTQPFFDCELPTCAFHTTNIVSFRNKLELRQLYKRLFHGDSGPIVTRIQVLEAELAALEAKTKAEATRADKELKLLAMKLA